ncbi:phosphate regulon sensor histidine kinase PhoR [Cognatiluteimonas telluris]|uniref:phosphate regulon sensor histidine kinase PhoR n=1 Tax=Cognatiluteimonas telluris TaxID=1104775 RepID=UPI00140E611A|nr:phosphate regulon sensor histidine kinase PhoR [Lysobacter telluris]
MRDADDAAWWRSLAGSGLLLVVAAIAGWLAGRPWAFVAMAALALAGWQLWSLWRVLQRLSARSHAPVGHGRGGWQRLQRLLHRGQQEARVRNRKLVALLRAYRAAADALPDAVVVVEPSHQRIVWFNQAATRLLGLVAPADIDAALGERLPGLSIAHWLASGRHAEPIADIASPMSPQLRLSLRLVPYSDELWLLVARDVSKLVRLEGMRRDFVANVSHELRTPLTVVHGYLEMLDPAELPAWAPMLAEMQRQSQRMTQLVDDLLTLSRLESQDTIADDSVAMQPMLAALRNEAHALSQGRHDIIVEDAAPLDLLGSQQQLHSAFSNLVSNAVRYTPGGGSIRIGFEAGADGGAVLWVRDSGRGIAAEHLPRLTERFYRVSTSRSRESGGTGLGLAIVKHVLQLHQADLAIESQPGSGSRFACRFPPERVQHREPGSN